MTIMITAETQNNQDKHTHTHTHTHIHTQLGVQPNYRHSNRN